MPSTKAEAYVNRDPVARHILDSTLRAIHRRDPAAATEAMDEAEEMGGPTGASYTGLMLLIRRAAAAQGMRSVYADAGRRVAQFRAARAGRPRRR